MHVYLRVVSNGVLLAVTFIEEKQLYGLLCGVISIDPDYDSSGSKHV